MVVVPFAQCAWHNHLMRRITAAFLVGASILALPWHVADVAAAGPAVPLRAEVQISVCSTLRDVVKALGLRKAGPVTTVWLFDDAALSLYRRGLRLRLRVDVRDADLTLKVADQDCAQIPEGAIPAGQGKCEFDLHGTAMAGAVSLSSPLALDRAEALMAGKIRVEDMLSPAQSRYLREVVRGDPLPAALLVLGPLSISSRRAADRTYALDTTTLPDGDQYLELTRKVPVADAQQVRHRIEQELARAGVELCADQSGQAGIKLRKLLPH